MTERQELLEAAARCYLRAGEQDGACRCFELCAAWAEAATLHEAQGRVRQAAARYEQAGRWLDAARCHHAAGDAEGEARCLAGGGEKLRAAWVLAHVLGRARAAEELIADTTASLAGETDILLARCDVLRGERGRAAKRLRTALVWVERQAVGPARQRLLDWALAVAEALRRPDLGALVLAASAGDAGAEAQWDAWAERTFGEAVAPPMPLDGADRGAVDEAGGEEP